MAKVLFQCLASQDVGVLRRTITMNEALVNSKNAQERSPLHVACALGWHEGVRELLRFRAAHDAVDKDGNTPLHVAAEQGSIEVVAELLQGQGRKMVVKAKNKDGRTPLHLAAKANHPLVAAKLLEAGARADAKDKLGQTPMHLVPNLGTNEAMVAALTGIAPAPETHFTVAPHAPIPCASPVKIPAKAKEKVPEQKDGQQITPGPTLRPRIPLAPGVAGATPSPAGIKTGASPAMSSFHMRASQLVDAGALRRAAGVPAPALATARVAPVTPVGARPGSGGGAAGTPAAGGSTAQTLQVHQAAITDLQNNVMKQQKELNEALSHASVAQAAADAQKELAAQLTAAMELIKAQSSRLEDVESRLLLSEERGREMRARLERSENATKDERETAAQRHKAQDTALKSLQSTLHRLSEDQHASQSLVGSLSHQIDRISSAASSAGGAAPHSGAKSGSRSGSDGGDDSLQTDVQNLKSSVSALRGVAERTEELVLQVAQLGAARGALSGEMDTLRGRLSRLEDVGAADRLDLLQLKVSQLSTSLSGLNTSHGELADKLAVLNRWKAEQQAVVGGAASTAAGTASVLSASSVPAIKELEAAVAQQAQKLTAAVQQVEAVVQQVTELKQTTTELSAKMTAPPPPPAPSTPTPAGLHTPHDVGSSKRYALAASMNANAEREVQELATDVHQLQANVTELKTALDEARTEMRLVTLELKREWEGAVAEAGVRYAEQRAEMEAREARVKAMKDSVLKEEETRTKAAEFETRVTSSLKGLETSLGLVQHKVEVLEEVVQGLQYRSRSVSGTQDESLASSRHQSCAGGRPNAGSSVLSPRASSGRASGSYAAQIAAAAAHKSHHTGGPGPVGEEHITGCLDPGSLTVEHAVRESLAQIISPSRMHGPGLNGKAACTSPQLARLTSSPLASSALLAVPTGLADWAGIPDQVSSKPQQVMLGHVMPHSHIEQASSAAVHVDPRAAPAAASSNIATVSHMQWAHKSGVPLHPAQVGQQVAGVSQQLHASASHGGAGGASAMYRANAQPGARLWNGGGMVPAHGMVSTAAAQAPMQHSQMMMAQPSVQVTAARQPQPHLIQPPAPPPSTAAPRSTPHKQAKPSKVKAAKEKCAMQ